MLSRLAVASAFALIASALTLASPVSAQSSLTTTFASNNGCNGNFFDVTTMDRALSVTQVAVNTSAGNRTVSVYTRPGPFFGFTNSPAGWTLVGTVTVNSPGSDVPTVADIPDFTLPANAVTGMFVHVAEGINYTNGAGLGTIVAQNADLQISDGIGQCNGAFSGSDNIPRTWNGTIFYGEGAPKVADTRTKTQQTIQRYLSRRNDQLLANGPDFNRQINRLTAGQPNDAVGASMFAQDGTSRPRHADVIADEQRRASAGSSSSLLGGPDVSGADNRLAAFGGGGLAGESPDPLDRSGSSLPVGFTVSGDRGEKKSFSTSFTQIAQAAAENKRRKLGGGEANLERLGIDGTMLASPRQFGLDVWAQGHIAQFREGEEGSRSEGDFAVLYLGADYVVSHWLLVGALVQYDRMDELSNQLGTNVEGHGWMVGPYATVRVTDNIFAQGRAAWGKSDVEISPFMTYSDEFETRRWLLEANIQGRWNVGRFLVAPHAVISYIEENQESYRDSMGFIIPDQRVSLGQMRFGPQVSYQMRAGDGSKLEPYAEIEGIWNFNEEGTELLTGAVGGREEFRGRVGLGFRATMLSGVSMDVSGRYDGIGADDFEAVSADVRMRYPLN